MEYKEFIDKTLAGDLTNIFNKMNELKILDSEEFRANLKILKEIRKDLNRSE